MKTITFAELLTLVKNHNVNNVEHYESDAIDGLFLNHITIDNSLFNKCEFLNNGGSVKFDNMYIRNNNPKPFSVSDAAVMSHISLFDDATEIFFDKTISSYVIGRMMFQIELK